MKVFVPPIKIQGKKTKLVPGIMEIAEMFQHEYPDDVTWVEPFCGSGVVAFNAARMLPNIRKVVVNDVNPHIIRLYSGIQSGEITPEKIDEVFHEHSRNLKKSGVFWYQKVKDRFNRSEDKSPMDFLFLTRTGFNGVMRFNSKGEWNIPYCKLDDRLSEKVISDLSGSVRELSRLYGEKEFAFMNGSFENVLEKYGENCLYYCDPPYFGLSTQYYRGWGMEDEVRLNSMLKGRHYIYSTWADDGKKKNPMIGELWSGDAVLEIDHKYHVAEKASDRNRVKEALIFPKIDSPYGFEPLF